MTSPVLVTGGTGRLGRHVVRRLRDAGCEVRVLTRRSRESAGGIEFVLGDLATGEGVAAAGDGAAAIVHCATPLGCPGSDPGHPRCSGWRSAASTRARRGPPDVGAVPDREPAGKGTRSHADGLVPGLAVGRSQA